MNPKVLFVDDDDKVLSAIYRNFRDRYRLDLASGGPQALRAMEEHGPYAVVVADMAMPGMNGIAFLKKAQVLAPDTVRVMLTGHPGPLTLMEAINNGQVFRFLAKPCPLEDLAAAVDAGVRQHNLAMAEKELLERTLAGSLGAMMEILEPLDPGLFRSARVLAERAVKVAQALEVPDLWPITVAALYSPLWLLPLPPSARVDAEPDPVSAGLQAAALARVAGLIQAIPRLEGVAQIIARLAPGPGEPPIGTAILRALLDFRAVELRVQSIPVALEELRLRGGRYDPAVLAALAGVLGLRPGGD